MTADIVMLSRDRGHRCPRCATGYLRYFEGAYYCSWCGDEYEYEWVEGLSKKAGS